ncbi:glycerol-3-phosphate acyltransferase [Proteiniclasticum ruminis]|uniref:Glycerol-3-phosphate acyltransferase n=1 Tax=Proteiniclasticum ruminis TaxID=398199 RepID=A0A1G8N849_9CLOT|nr:glycerol-3-phosphate acyltransferase [Proteiniclasticum ruminis]SDI76364.1 glycerol-3-phosphate acyltransferase PlsY [Proteiniclasticum ruminis]
MKEIIISAVVGYLLGNIQAAYILGKLIKKVDIRTMGQGNAGASNAVESLGWKFGVLVAIIDVLKGAVSILLIKMLFKVELNSEGAFLLYLAGYTAILGHIYPFYMNFKGGKGTATLIGILLGMNPLYGLIGILFIAATTFLTDYIVLGTAALTTYVVVLTYLKDLGPGALILSILGALLSMFLHRKNYKRIKLGTETRLSQVLGRKKK